MYHGSSKALCSAIARMARRIATENIHPQVLRSFIACRLIPLSKNPGVRPIGICETLRRIIGKAIMKIVGPDIQSVVGTSQLCAGQKSGCEVAVHLMQRLYEGDIEGVLLVDATNAFNSLNRRVMLYRRQELPLNGGNGNPTSGYEANERCAADHHDQPTRPAAHRVDHTISAAPDDLRSRSRTAAVHSVNVCMRCFIVCFV